MNTYGLVGYTLLEKDDINILILADVHDGVTYCKEDSIGISEWLKGKSKKSKILLEEVNLNNVNLTDLWPNSKHTQELKKLARTNSLINSVDIRPLLIPFSWELIDKHPKLGQYNISQYLNPIHKFFMNKGFLYSTIIVKELNKLDDITKNRVMTHHGVIKEMYKDILEKYPLKTSMESIYKKDKDFLEDISNLISVIMEWYIVLLSLNTNKNIIIHSGLAHTDRLIKTLEKFYKFKKVDIKGINKMSEINFSSPPNACMYIPEHINEKFKNKNLFFSFW